MRRVGSWLTESERDRIRDLVARGLHDTEIAVELVCARTTVFYARHRMGLKANRAQDRADTKARRGAAIVGALRAQDLDPGEATRIAYEIRSLHLGWAGHEYGHARVLHALEALEGGPATVVEIIDSASRDGTGKPMSYGMVQRAAVRLRRLGLLTSRRTKAPGSGRGATPAEYWLTTKAKSKATARDLRTLRSKPSLYS